MSKLPTKLPLSPHTALLPSLVPWPPSVLFEPNFPNSTSALAILFSYRRSYACTTGRPILGGITMGGDADVLGRW